MYRAKDIEMTCGACPSQWEGHTDDNRPIYARYRWGFLSVCVGSVGGDSFNALDGVQVFAEQIGDEYHGVMSTSEMIRLTSHVIDWQSAQHGVQPTADHANSGV